MDKWLIGIDLGGTTTKLAFLTEEGFILRKWEIPTDITNNGERIVPNITYSLQEKLAEMNQTKKNVLGIGIGAPGAIDHENGIVFEAVNLGWKEGYALKENLAKAVGLPVILDNDANCAALGEMWTGAGKGAKDLICVTLGTGVGGGIITNGQVVHGIKGAGGEIGHMTIDPFEGYQCNCGKRGCLETVASATGIVRIAKDQLSSFNKASVLKTIMINEREISAKDVFDAMRAGDELAREIVNRFAFYLGLAIANLGNVLNPEAIIIGGGVSKAGDTLLNPVKKYFSAFTFSTVRESSHVSIASLGNDAGVVGAAWLVQHSSW
ncbi:ROK family glucokinase [Bacillus chungangensis]|uniref:Glucokinase n=1 Tax=Bacillus chungangensis TaxID=587633 RepID=A0ABT9WQG2_9BACI|nr:ROK family glucokinase [Bacillus chungangensis]MDQ0175187.1 glucokinase [Bacillus chungangensis]